MVTGNISVKRQQRASAQADLSSQNCIMNLQNCIVASLNQASEQCFRPCLPDDFERSQNHQPYEEQAKTTTHHHCFTLLEPRMKGLPHTQGKEETRNLVRRIRLYILMRVLLDDLKERDAAMFEAVRSVSWSSIPCHAVLQSLTASMISLPLYFIGDRYIFRPQLAIPHPLAY